ncbi:hypothetical protein [Rhizobium sp. ICMP 5592]|uniref:ABC transporter ATP-binding protein n=1 Tax=Rhizobium sp. ICMP 5592 TaxID=2292445 RepID=UPI0012971988|nr:hypothetical protein [Rhizobium sp. ICMP 5592]MQB46261.1 hypothetical protein [Rhizobium sp. ICMP 5592]
MPAVGHLSHRVAVKYLGEIVEIGPCAVIFDDPRHPYIRKLLSVVPTINIQQRRIRRGILGSELKSPIRPANFVPVSHNDKEVSPGQFVQI